MEREGLKIHGRISESMVEDRTREVKVTLKDNQGVALEQTISFKYLGTLISAKGDAWKQ